MGQEESLICTDVSGKVSSVQRSAVRFQGKNCPTSSGVRSPVAAQLSKYHESQRRGFKPHCLSVAMIENMASVGQTLQREPQP